MTLVKCEAQTCLFRKTYIFIKNKKDWVTDAKLLYRKSVVEVKVRLGHQHCLQAGNDWE